MSAEIVCFPLTANGVRTRVLEAGEGDRCLLFIHGLGARADRWRRNLPVLAEQGYRCIALDLPGHGLADKGPGIPATIGDLAAFVAAAARALDLASPLLVGTSLGGHIAGRMALEGMVAARGLMMIGTLGLFPLEPAVAAAIRGSVVETSLEAIGRKLAFVMKVQDGITPGFVREEFMINNSAGARDAFARLGEYLVGQPASDIIGPRLSGLAARIPLSIVWGAQDQAVPTQIGVDAERLLGLPSPVLIEGTGHAPYWEKADEFNRLLGTFATSAFARPA